MNYRNRLIYTPRRFRELFSQTWRHINASKVAVGPRQPPTDEWDPLAHPKCALVNLPSLLPPPTTRGGARPFFILSVGAPSSSAALPASPTCVDGVRELHPYLAPPSTTHRACGPSPLSLPVTLLPPRSALHAYCAPYVGNGRELYHPFLHGRPTGARGPSCSLSSDPPRARASSAHNGGGGGG
jgi:hypothetical protein